MSVISRFSDVTRIALFGVLGAVLIDLALMFVFGAKESLLQILYACLVIWVAIVGLSLIVFWVRRGSGFEESSAWKVSFQKYRRLGLLGILICFLPVPWFLLLSHFYGSPERVSLLGAIGPAIAAFVIGICLLVYSQIARWQLLLRGKNMEKSGRNME